MKPIAKASSDLSAELSQSFLELVEVVARLRAPDGCPWDRQQTHASVARNITEEAAEVVDAIERENLTDLREELGDLLLQVLLQSQMASEADEFTLAQVIDGITRKLVRRHPHVFGTTAALDAAELTQAARQHLEEQIQAAASPEAVLELWDNIKLIERQQKNQDQKAPSTLDSVPNALPALMQAQDISRKAISVGFDWAGVEEVWQQLASEISEFQAEPSGSPAAADEFGDMLFSLVNIG
ncbi:MAG: nucleoside triphosphate pyrophosphohydrolase, partial [Coriobacteriales bacterium]|nr:nucleoside triphosphate pyrophosphohydrolase [Coriobacteriales bacterium]